MNKNISTDRVKDNYSLLDERQVLQHHGDVFGLKTLTPYEMLKSLLDTAYVYNRPDVNVVCEWVWSLPPEIQGEEDERKFFQEVHNFLTRRYSIDGSGKHVLQSIVHMDEEYADKKGNICLHKHLHFCFCPLIPDEKRRQGKTECVNASKVITLKELKTIHKELEEYLHSKGIKAKIRTGITKAQGGNRSIERIKREHEQERERKLERSHDIERGFSR